MVTFVIGGLTGVLLAVPPADFLLHNSLFLVAHFHNVIIGGVLFGAFAGYTYWFPKAFGFRLDECWGRRRPVFWIVGFYVAFMPLYVVGLEGMTRRLQHYDVPEWRPWLLIAAFGALLILAGIVCQIVQLVVSIRGATSLRDVTGDPWDGRSLEWSTASPPPGFNFAVLPKVEDEDHYWGVKQRARSSGDSTRARTTRRSRCRATARPAFVCAFFATVMGFALIWHIWWLVGVAFVGAYATFVVFAWRDHDEEEIPRDASREARPRASRRAAERAESRA